MMPPSGEARNTGNWLAKPTAPSLSDETGGRDTSQDWATVCIQVPMREMSCPLKKSWKLRWRMARKAAGRRRASEDPFVSGGFCDGASDEATFYDAARAHCDATGVSPRKVIGVLSFARSSQLVSTRVVTF